MPKIIFRPNPAPPPFVPPGPSYDTSIKAISEYETYNELDPISLKFLPAQVPPFETFIIKRNGNEICTGYESDFNSNDFSPLDTVSEGSVPFNGAIEFWGTDDQGDDIIVWNAEIEVSLQ